MDCGIGIKDIDIDIFDIIVNSNKFADCVLPGVLLVLANFLDLVIALMILDLPTLERPIKQHSIKLLNEGIFFTSLKEPMN